MWRCFNLCMSQELWRHINFDTWQSLLTSSILRTYQRERELLALWPMRCYQVAASHWTILITWLHTIGLQLPWSQLAHVLLMRHDRGMMRRWPGSNMANDYWSSWACTGPQQRRMFFFLNRRHRGRRCWRAEGDPPWAVKSFLLSSPVLLPFFIFQGFLFFYDVFR